MEDILKFLLVAGVLVVAFIRQARKEAQKKQASRPPVMPRPETPPSDHPDGQKDQTYGGYIPEGPPPAPAAPPSPKSRRTAATVPPKTPRRQDTPVPPPPAKTPETEDNSSDFRIQSVEEARRAIIWGEILNRKY